MSDTPKLPAVPLPLPVPKVKMPAATSSVEGNKQIFKKLDDDKDGSLSKDELMNDAKGVKAKISELKLKEFDKNKDGELSQKEFHNGRQEERENLRPVSRENVSKALFKLRDEDKDGKLGEGEIGKKSLKAFDKNGDGELTGKEFHEGRQERWEENRHKAAKGAGADKPQPKDKD